MKRNKLKLTKGSLSHTAAVVIGVAVATLVSILLTAWGTNLILNGYPTEKCGAAIIFVIRAVSVLIGALIGALLLNQNYLKLSCNMFI